MAGRCDTMLIAGRVVIRWESCVADGYAEDRDLSGLIDTSAAHQARIYDYWLGRKIEIF
jgi:hypothetical protein